MNAKYDEIGINYNLTRKADEYLTEQFLKYLNPKQSDRYLDIGCGTGNYTNEFQKRGFQFIGIDPSIEMLEQAKIKNQAIDWRLGTAEKTGLANHYVDGIIASLTIHHWTDLNKGFSELFRVLKENGQIIIFTSTPTQMSRYWLNHYFPIMLKESILQMPELESVESAMGNANFEIIETKKYAIQPNLQDKFLYCGKHNPALYFDKNIRQGISSFSALANKAEIAQGLTDLRKDIDSGKISRIIKSYANDLGDYLFIVGRKR